MLPNRETKQLDVGNYGEDSLRHFCRFVAASFAAAFGAMVVFVKHVRKSLEWGTPFWLANLHLKKKIDRI